MLQTSNLQDVLVVADDVCHKAVQRILPIAAASLELFNKLGAGQWMCERMNVEPDAVRCESRDRGCGGLVCEM